MLQALIIILNFVVGFIKLTVYASIILDRCLAKIGDKASDKLWTWKANGLDPNNIHIHSEENKSHASSGA